VKKDLAVGPSEKSERGGPKKKFEATKGSILGNSASKKRLWKRRGL